MMSRQKDKKKESTKFEKTKLQIGEEKKRRGGGAFDGHEDYDCHDHHDHDHNQVQWDSYSRRMLIIVSILAIATRMSGRQD